MISFSRKTSSQPVPKAMLPTYEAVVALTDAFCAEHLNTEYRDLARRMAAALCRERSTVLWARLAAGWSIVESLTKPLDPRGPKRRRGSLI